MTDQVLCDYTFLTGKNKGSTCDRVCRGGGTNGKCARHKTVKCGECDFTSTGSGGLRVHIAAVHNKQKTIQCPRCVSTFSRREHLQRHILSVHDKQKEFHCTICEFASSTQSDLIRHVSASTISRKMFNVPSVITKATEIVHCGNIFVLYMTSKRISIVSFVHTPQVQTVICKRTYVKNMRK